MDLDITGAGKDWNAIQNALKGKGKAEVVNGALVDINLAESVLSGATGIPGAAEDRFWDSAEPLVRAWRCTSRGAF